ncbi:MAG: BatD family protein, partial [Bacteroidales bacterium]|nr:BatD family protein [Bacteroidales bacterium]
MRRIFAILTIMFAAVSPLGAQSFTVDAPNVVAKGENFRVVFTADADIDDFEWAPPSEFTLVWGPQRGFQSSVSIINGKRESVKTVTYTFVLQANSVGTHALP